MEIRAAAEGDEVRIAELSGQLGYPASAHEVRDRLARIASDPGHAVFVADLPGTKVAGWIQIFLDQVVMSELRVEVAGLVVDERCRGLGVGRALMGRAEAWARERGCGVVSLRSNVVRKKAHEFYLGLGYSIVKTQHAFRKKL